MVVPSFGPALRDAHAVVIGGSMAGLFAARVLAEQVAQVTIVERDDFPLTPEQRKGVPQAYHAHALLAAGQVILQQLFPDLMADLIADGAVVGHDVIPIAIVSSAGRFSLPDTLPTFVAFSRVLLEWHVREHLRRWTNVRLLPQTAVTGLLAIADGSRVTGITYRPRGEQGQPETMPADLVIDASGRSSRIIPWLADLGYAPPPEERITSGLGYASRIYRPHEGFSAAWQILVIHSRPPYNPRAGIILPIEQGQWHVSLDGIGGYVPPTDEDGFLQWARDLADPSLFEAIRDAQPLTPIRGYRTPVNHWRHFERLSRWPAGLIAMGDAVCAFNPVYGQGMTVSALEAQTLARCLQDQHGPLAPAFSRHVQQRLAENIALAWLVNTSDDLRWPEVTLSGARQQALVWLAQRYQDMLVDAAVTNSHIAQTYVDVLGMISSPRELVHPRFISQVCTSIIKRHFSHLLPPKLALSPQAMSHKQAQPVTVGKSRAER